MSVVEGRLGGGARVRVDGLTVPHRIDQSSGRHLNVFEVPKGSHQVQITPWPADCMPRLHGTQSMMMTIASPLS
jgi:hypothetical protein